MSSSCLQNYLKLNSRKIIVTYEKTSSSKAKSIVTYEKTSFSKAKSIVLKHCSSKSK